MDRALGSQGGVLDRLHGPPGFNRALAFSGSFSGMVQIRTEPWQPLSAPDDPRGQRGGLDPVPTVCDI